MKQVVTNLASTPLVKRLGHKLYLCATTDMRMQHMPQNSCIIDLSQGRQGKQYFKNVLENWVGAEYQNKRVANQQ